MQKKHKWTVMLADLDMTAQRSHKSSLLHTYKIAQCNLGLKGQICYYAMGETLHNLEEKEHQAAKRETGHMKRISKDF